MESLDTTDEKDLLRKLRERDELAFSQIYLKHHAPLCHFAGELLGDEDGGRDIVDDVFLKLWEYPKGFNDAGHLKAFLYHAIRNAALDCLRSDRRRTLRDGAYSASQDIPEESYLAAITQTEVLTELYAAIGGLPAQAAKIIRKAYLEGKSNKEVADELQLSVNTVKNQKRRGIALLRGKLSKEGYQVLLALAGIH